MFLDNIYINCRFLSQKLTGVQRYSYEVIKSLDRCNLIIPDKIQGCYDLKDLSQHNFIKLKLTKTYIWDHFQVPKLVPRNKVLWTPMGTGSLFCRNQILTIHDVAPLENSDFFSKKFTLYYKFLYKRVASRCLKVLTVSKYSKSRIIELLDIYAKNITVVYPGISSDFVNKSYNKSYNKSANNLVSPDISLHKPYFLCVASLSKRKNIQRLINAWLDLDIKYRDQFELIRSASSQLVGQ